MIGGYNYWAACRNIVAPHNLGANEYLQASREGKEVPNDANGKHRNELGDGFYIVVGWSYGAIVALGAAIVSLGIAIAAIRDHPRAN